MSRSTALVAAGGAVGATGVALSALAAHGDAANTQTAATFLLIHAPAFLALGLARTSTPLRIAGLVLLLGVALFAGDLVARDHLGTRLFPFAAPAGGILMIAGWLALAFLALVDRSQA